MEKKRKSILLLILMIAVVLTPLKSVNAHSIDLDPKSLISMPMFIYGESGTISISSSVTDYTLYFQAVKVTTSAFSQMQTIKTNGDKELKKLKETYTALETDMNNLKETYDTAYDAYKEGLKNTYLTTEEVEALKTAYETAKTNYQNKIKEYNDKIDEYNNKVNTINTQIKELTPMYVESNWTKTTDNKVSVDITKFSGEQPYAVWAKLVTSSGTYYDENIYTITGTQTTEVGVTGVSLDKSTLSLTEGSSYTLIATIKPSDATNKTLIWTSDKENVAKVENGKITGIAEGSANITVTTKDGDYTAMCKVTVNKKVENSSTTEDKKNDTTTADGKLPQTGVSKTIVFIIISTIVIAGIFFIKYSNYKDLK